MPKTRKAFVTPLPAPGYDLEARSGGIAWEEGGVTFIDWGNRVGTTASLTVLSSAASLVARQRHQRAVEALTTRVASIASLPYAATVEARVVGRSVREDKPPEFVGPDPSPLEPEAPAFMAPGSMTASVESAYDEAQAEAAGTNSHFFDAEVDADKPVRGERIPDIPKAWAKVTRDEPVLTSYPE